MEGKTLVRKKSVWVMNLKDSVGMVCLWFIFCWPKEKDFFLFETKFDQASLWCNFKIIKNTLQNQSCFKRRNAMAGISRIYCDTKSPSEIHIMTCVVGQI